MSAHLVACCNCIKCNITDKTSCVKKLEVVDATLSRMQAESHLADVVRSLPVLRLYEIVWRYLYPIQRYYHFYEIQYRHLGFVGGRRGTTHDSTVMVAIQRENLVIILKKIILWIVVVHAWQSYLCAQNFSFWVLLPEFRGTSFTPPEGTSLLGMTRFGYPVCALYWSALCCQLFVSFSAFGVFYSNFVLYKCP